MAKNFRKSAAEMYITDGNDNQAAKPAFEIPEGYRLVRENKNARMQLLVRENTKKALKRAAILEGVSLNELANRIFDDYIAKKEDA